MSDTEPAACPIHDVQRLIGGKWCFVVLWHLRAGTRRFAEIERAIGNVSAKALTESLRHLERAGLLTRTAYPTIPPRVEYALRARADAGPDPRISPGLVDPAQGRDPAVGGGRCLTSSSWNGLPGHE